MSTEGATWLEPIRRHLARCEANGGLLLIFPEYRPDLAKEVANRLNLRFYDYRENRLRPLGPDAYKVGLEDLDEMLLMLDAEGGAVVFNIEALLATKNESERARWLASFLARDWGSLMVLPLTLFASDVTSDSGRVLYLDAEALPEQSLLSRFLH